MKIQPRTILRNLFVLLLVVVSVLVLSGCKNPQSTKLEIEEKEIFVNEGDEYNLEVTVEPADAKITWQSSNEEVVTVEDGKIVAVSPGTATVSVKSRNQIFFVRVVVKGDDPALKEIILKGGKSDGGDLAIVIREGIVFKLKPAPYKTGHTFSHWTIGKGGPVYNDNLPVAAELELYPVYVLNDQTISFYVNDELYAETTTKYGEAPALPEEPAAPEGYEFGGWRGLLEEIYFDRRVDAIFTPKAYEVKFLVDGRAISTQSIAYGRSAIAPAAPAKEGFDFIGWDKEYNNVRGDLELNAVYRCKEYYQSVKFYVDGRLYAEQSVLRGDDAVVPAAPEKLGHSFKEWDKAITNVMEDLAVNAVFEKNKYEVKFYKDGELLETQTVEHGAAAVLPANPVKEGYKFVKWDKYLGSVKGDLTVNAVFEKNKYTVKLYVYGEQYGDPIIVEHGEALEFTAPEVRGYRFVEWDRPVDSVKSNLNLNAIFEIRYYQVQFLVDGVPYGDVQTIKFGDDAELPATNPDKYGYEFVGWDKDHTNVDDDLQINAVFNSVFCSVKFYVDGVQYGPEQMIEHGKDAEKPADPEKLGHTFSKWDKELTNILVDTKINAIFDKNSYTVKFLVDGEQYGEIVTVVYGEAVPLPEDPIKPTYTFKGWDKDLTSMPAENIETNAKFELNKYDVKFLDGDVVIETVEVEHGSYVSAIAGPDKVAHEFVGWCSDSALETAFNFEAAIVGHTNIYAKYNSFIVPMSQIRTDEIAMGQEIYVQGIVTQLIGNNAYMQDATGGTYLYVGGTPLEGLAKGSELIIKGKKGIYNGLYQLTAPSIAEIVKTEQPLPAAVELDSLANLADYQSQLVSLKKLLLKAKPTPNNNGYNVSVELDGIALTLRVDKYLEATEKEALATFFGGLEVGDRLDVVAPVGFFNNPQMALASAADVALAALTDEDKVGYALEALDLPAETGENLDLPLTGLYDTTIAWSSDNTAVISDEGVVTRQATDVTVNLTATVTLGDASQSKIFQVLVPALGGEVVSVVYETGFEAAEGFEKSTTYNNQEEKAFGAKGEWITYYGTATTTDKITGEQSIQSRHYGGSAPDNMPYVIFDGTQYATKISKIDFNYKFNNATTSINVEFSADKVTWTLGLEINAPNTSSNPYSVESPIENALYVRFIVTQGTGTTTRYTIDDVKVYGVA